MKRDDFSSSTKELLAKRVAYRCSNPCCQRITIGAHSNPEKIVNIGEAAHITAAAIGGPRYDINLSNNERSSINNAIWLCPSCHDMVDRDVDLYPVELLREWKEKAERSSSYNIRHANSLEKIVKTTDFNEQNKCKVAYFIGNGFDISMHMGTSYEDFFKWFCLHIEGYFNINYSDFFYKRMSKKNRWNTWGDFEKDLISFASSLEDDESREEFKLFYFTILSKLAEYIRLRQGRIMNFIEVSNENSYEIFRDSIVNWYKELSGEQQNLIYKRHENLKIDNQDISFINFNYSTVLDILLERSFPSPNITHIHGNIFEKENLVLGVDDVQLIETSFKQEELYYLLKNNIIDGLQNNWNRIVDHRLCESEIVIVFGMSLSRTDSMWWKKVIQWLLADNHDLVIFWHSTDYIQLLDKVSLRNSICQRLLRFENLRYEDLHNVLEKIHIVINAKEILRFDVSKWEPQLTW